MPAAQPPTAAESGTFQLGGDLPIHRLGFGAMRLTGTGIWGEPRDRAEAIRVLRRAVDLGVNFIDTADSYGPEVSETIIAEALHPYPRTLVIATKGGLVRPGPDQWEPDGSPRHLREALEGSLRRLRLDRIDLYQFHRPDPKVPFEESVGTLADLRREGKIRHVGLSNVTTAQLDTARRIVPIVSVQNRYNLVDRASEPVLDACQREGLAFLPWFPLATGNLTHSGGALDRVAAEHDRAPGQIALAWLLRRSPVVVVIPGTSSVAHLEENVAASGIHLSRHQVDHLEQSTNA
ncbi:MAG TPA: aldo/keto reductase [Ktedonobacterales bacterium]|jgi:aryl-alcohol dehydrogenase-like predicted oxidoreductase